MNELDKQASADRGKKIGEAAPPQHTLAAWRVRFTPVCTGMGRGVNSNAKTGRAFFGCQGGLVSPHPLGLEFRGLPPHGIFPPGIVITPFAGR